MIDSLGRRPVMLIANVLLFTMSCLMLATQFLAYFFGPSLLTKVLYVILDCIGESTTATGIMSLRILFITELFPPSARTAVSQAVLFIGMAINSLLMATFPIVYSIFPPGFFAPFVVTKLVFGFYLYRHMPETKGRAVCDIIEDMDEDVMSRTASIFEEYTPLIKSRKIQSDKKYLMIFQGNHPALFKDPNFCRSIKSQLNSTEWHAPSVDGKSCEEIEDSQSCNNQIGVPLAVMITMILLVF
ncbi:unnamed protein product [Caenorhabditis nigoni]